MYLIFDLYALHFLSINKTIKYFFKNLKKKTLEERNIFFKKFLFTN